MKRKSLLLLAILCFLAAFFLAKEVFGAEALNMPEDKTKPKNELAFDILKFLGGGIHVADSAISWDAFQKGYGEKNPLASWASKNPALWMGQTAGLIGAKQYVSQKLYDENKTIGYLIAILLAGMQTKAIYDNLKLMTKK